jgi:hypothetical protein
LAYAEHLGELCELVGDEALENLENLLKQIVNNYNNNIYIYI